MRSRILAKICGYSKTPTYLIRHAMYFKYVHVFFQCPKKYFIVGDHLQGVL